MGFFAYGFAERFLLLINTPADMIGMTRNYIRIISLGVPFMYGYFILQAAMQGTGNTMVALRIQLTATVINIPLDALLIFGAGLGSGMGRGGRRCGYCCLPGCRLYGGDDYTSPREQGDETPPEKILFPAGMQYPCFSGWVCLPL